MPPTKSAVQTRSSWPATEEAQLRHLLGAMKAMRDGTFTRRLAPTGSGVLAELATFYDEIADRQLHLATELGRVRRLAGRDGRHAERLTNGIGQGSWATSIEAANSLVTDLVRPAEDFARVVSAVSAGDLTQRMAVRVDGRPLRGDPLRVAKDVNGLVDQLSAIADEITRVTREVGTEGKLGGKARVRSADGTWRDLIDAVNTMSSQLTAQVRDIALVTTAVANGDLSRTVTDRGVGRDGTAEGHGRPDGRPAVVVRRRGHPRRPRGRHRGAPRRPGRRAGRVRAPGRTSPTPSTRWRPT